MGEGRWGGTVSLLSLRMTRYAALSRDDVPENLAMMFITFPAAKDPTYEQRHPGTALGVPSCPPPTPHCGLGAPQPLRHGVGTATATPTGMSPAVPTPQANPA